MYGCNFNFLKSSIESLAKAKVGIYVRAMTHGCPTFISLNQDRLRVEYWWKAGDMRVI